MEFHGSAAAASPKRTIRQTANFKRQASIACRQRTAGSTQAERFLL
jgi:hypothetical protein